MNLFWFFAFLLFNSLRNGSFNFLFFFLPFFFFVLLLLGSNQNTFTFNLLFLQIFSFLQVNFTLLSFFKYFFLGPVYEVPLVLHHFSNCQCVLGALNGPVFCSDLYRVPWWIRLSVVLKGQSPLATHIEGISTDTSTSVEEVRLLFQNGLFLGAFLRQVVDLDIFLVLLFFFCP